MLCYLKFEENSNFNNYGFIGALADEFCMSDHDKTLLCAVFLKKSLSPISLMYINLVAS